MEQALLELLRRLEAIEAEHDGLGDTNVRDHMWDHVFHGFLRPEPTARPTSLEACFLELLNRGGTTKVTEGSVHRW